MGGEQNRVVLNVPYCWMFVYDCR